MHYTHGTIVNIYFVCGLCASGFNHSDPILKTCLFGAVTSTKSADMIGISTLVMGLDLIEDQAFYSGYWICSRCINF